MHTAFDPGDNLVIEQALVALNVPAVERGNVGQLLSVSGKSSKLNLAFVLQAISQTASVCHAHS